MAVVARPPAVGAGPRSPLASVLSALLSRRFRFLPLALFVVLFASLVLWYARSIRKESHTGAHFTHVDATTVAQQQLIAAQDTAASASAPAQVPRPVIEEHDDPSKVRLPLAEDETARLTEMLASKARHRHVFDAQHNHTHEVLSEEQQRRLDALKAEEEAATAECRRLAAARGIVPGSSWGEASEDERLVWRRSNCDGLLVIEDYRAFLAQHPELYDPVVVPPERVSPGNRSTAHDVIAVCVSTTSRHLELESIEDMTLFKSLLPSIGDTVEAGFEYWVYLLYDEGDPFLDTDATRAAIQSWFDRSLVAPLAQRGIALRHVPVRYANFLRKPGPAFNFMTHLAFVDGADWLYRINDDTYFMTEWASSFVKTLQALGPPYGVVGPLCREGATAILTHDFTHRTHHLALRHHYPPPLSDWWMDDVAAAPLTRPTSPLPPSSLPSSPPSPRPLPCALCQWISRVYGRKRTKRSYDVIVKHLVKSSGTKYNIDGKHALLLGTELEAGRRAIERYMQQSGLVEELDAYQHDEFSFTP